MYSSATGIRFAESQIDFFDPATAKRVVGGDGRGVR